MRKGQGEDNSNQQRQDRPRITQLEDMLEISLCHQDGLMAFAHEKAGNDEQNQKDQGKRLQTAGCRSASIQEIGMPKVTFGSDD